MSRKSLPSDISFADGEIDSYIRDGSKVKVRIFAWNRKRLELIFKDVIRLLDNGIGDIADVCIETLETEFLSSSLDLLYENVPESHPYKEFIFLNSDDTLALRIVAESVSINVIK